MGVFLIFFAVVGLSISMSMSNTTDPQQTTPVPVVDNEPVVIPEPQIVPSLDDAEEYEMPIPIIEEDTESTPIEKLVNLECSNDEGLCYESTLARIIDGDTVKDADDNSIRFSLASAPELSESGGPEAKRFIEELCPVGSTILVDEDDLQTQGSYGRIIAHVECDGIGLNEELVISEYGTVDKRFCNTSEFKDEPWTGCV